MKSCYIKHEKGEKVMHCYDYTQFWNSNVKNNSKQINQSDEYDVLPVVVKL